MSLDKKIKDAKEILNELQHGPLTWSELERRSLSRGGTHWKFTSIMGWLSDNGYIIKQGPSVSRAAYQVNCEKVDFDNGAIRLSL